MQAGFSGRHIKNGVMGNVMNRAEQCLLFTCPGGRLEKLRSLQMDWRDTVWLVKRLRQGLILQIWSWSASNIQSNFPNTRS